MLYSQNYGVQLLRNTRTRRRSCLECGHLPFYNLHSNTDSSHSMNEPHDVPDIVKWADTVQQAVTAIRKAG